MTFFDFGGKLHLPVTKTKSTCKQQNETLTLIYCLRYAITFQLHLCNQAFTAIVIFQDKFKPVYVKKCRLFILLLCKCVVLQKAVF